MNTNTLKGLDTSEIKESAKEAKVVKHVTYVRWVKESEEVQSVFKFFRCQLPVDTKKNFNATQLRDNIDKVVSKFTPAGLDINSLLYAIEIVKRIPNKQLKDIEKTINEEIKNASDAKVGAAVSK